MSEVKKSARKAILGLAIVLLLYALSYGPAWSIIARTNNYNILEIYNILPEEFKTDYLTLWMKLDKQVDRAARASK